MYIRGCLGKSRPMKPSAIVGQLFFGELAREHWFQNNLDDDKDFYVKLDNWENEQTFPLFVLITLDLEFGYLGAEAVKNVFDLDMLISKGQGQIDYGDIDARRPEWRYGFSVDNKGFLNTKDLEDKIWFGEQWSTNDEGKEPLLEFHKDLENTLRFYIDQYGWFQVGGNDNELLFSAEKDKPLNLVSSSMLSNWQRIIKERRAEKDTDDASMCYVLFDFANYLFTLKK